MTFRPPVPVMSFALSTFIDRIAGVAPAPTINLDSNQDRRRALIARAQRAAREVQEPAMRDHEAEAQSLVMRLSHHYGIVTLRKDARSVDSLDAFVDAARTRSPHVLTDEMLGLISSWVGEYVRYEMSLGWTEDDMLTDGRLLFDPGSIVAARASSAKAPTIAGSIAHLAELAQIEAMKAA